jgi:hypothetical protein
MVLKPLISGRDIMRDRRDRWVIDFGIGSTEREAALFEDPFGWVQARVKPDRALQNRESRKRYWWRFGETMPKMRGKISALNRYLATSLSSKHRSFVWVEHPALVDSTCVVIAKDDYTTFGILHSRFHLIWAIRQGNWLGAGNDSRYTPTTTFDTFPFPEDLTPNIPANDYENNVRGQAIAEAAKRLDELRNAWLNPPDLVNIEPEAEPGYPDRILPKDAQAAITLKTRTLTNLYNQRPQWLLDAHRDLDVAVAAAYGWLADISEEEALAKLLELNLARAGAELMPDLIEEPDDED